MRYLFLVIAGLWLVPSQANAATLDMSKAFQIAASQKLGAAIEDDSILRHRAKMQTIRRTDA